MADITRAGLWRHLRATPTSHVVQLRRGRVVRSGPGLSFWFRPLVASLSEVPVDDRELPLLFHARTADYQDVSVQATVGYRIVDADAAAARIDFAIDPDRGTWRANPLDQVALLLTELAQQHALDLLAAQPLSRVLDGGAGPIRERVTAGLMSDARLTELGIEVAGVRVIAVRAEPEVERALQTPARERVQQEADKATYERRALAVERERAISENELQSRIELATREELLVAQQGANARRRAQEAAAAARIEAESAAAQEDISSAARAAGLRRIGEAEGDAERARLAAYADADPRVLAAMALRELADHLPTIGTINVSPDLVQTTLGRLLGAQALRSGSVESQAS